VTDQDGQRPEDDAAGREEAAGPAAEPAGARAAAPEPEAAEPAEAERTATAEDPAPRAAGEGGPEAGRPALDEQAAWEAIVAGYGQEPPDPPGARPFRAVEDLALLEPPPGQGDGWDGTGGRAARPAPAKEGDGSGDEPKDAGPTGVRPLGGSVSFAPGVGPRDHRSAGPEQPAGGAAADDPDDEGHFVPPEPPPLPPADTTTRFAWLGVVGGPLLLLVAIVFGWQMTWWITVPGIGGFVGGFFTLVARMNPDDEDGDDPGRGAVV
jgi:hypothetical protein